jgi:glycosyltransferase involved in cell wall biosynthesis
MDRIFHLDSFPAAFCKCGIQKGKQSDQGKIYEADVLRQNRNQGENMKRICVYGACENLGGTEIYLITISRLLKAEIKLDYLLAHDCKEIPFEAEIISIGGKIYREYFRYEERNASDYISPKQIIEKHPEWDGIYINVQRIHTAYSLLAEAKKAGLQYRIIHAHNSGCGKKKAIKDRVYETYFHLTRKRVVTNYLACSEQAGKWMYGRNVATVVMPDAVDFEKFQLNDSRRKKMRGQYGLKKEDIVIGFCGRLSYQKNPQKLIHIFRELCKNANHYKLLMVGEGDLREEVQKLIGKYKLEDAVILTGNQLETEDYYQMMDCFVLPSRYEGFGIVLLEAQAAGLRCYTTERVVPDETNLTGRVTFIPESAPVDTWVQAIEANGFDRVDCLEKLEKSEYSLNILHCKLRQVFDLT